MKKKVRTMRKRYEWEKRGLAPVDRHPRKGDLRLAIRRGKHACQRGAVHIRSLRLVGIER